MFARIARRPYLLTIAVVTATVVGPSPIALGVHPPVAFDELCHTADAVFAGTVTSLTSRWGPAYRTILTDATFEQVMTVQKKPGVPADTTNRVTLTFEGGRIDGFGLEVSTVPTLRVGQRYVVFCLLDGRRRMNPILGGSQGLFRLTKDAALGTEHVLAANGAGVAGLQGNELRLSPRVTGIVKGQPTYTTRITLATADPPSAGGGLLATPRAVAPPTSILTFDQFATQIRATLAGPAPAAPALRGIPSLSERLKAPRKTAAWDNAAVSQATANWTSMCVCGTTELPHHMEMVPENWLSWAQDHEMLQIYNRFADIYREDDDDGTIGDNFESEFAGWMTDDDLDDVYGDGGWDDGTIAVCKSWYRWYGGSCGDYYETDIICNSEDYTWGFSLDECLDTAKVLYRAAMVHELGHSWGAFRGDCDETYEYGVPTVMHSTHHDIIEDGKGIHASDAWGMRELYADLAVKDVGVESYYADGYLKFSTFNKASFTVSESITINNMTAENMSSTPLDGVRMKFYLSTDRTITTSDYPMTGHVGFGTFGKEAVWVGNISMTIPIVPSGTYYVGVIITTDGDAWNLDDIPENNATSFKTPITVTCPTPGVRENLQINSVPRTDRIEVTWSLPSSPMLSHCEIWRGTTLNIDDATLVQNHWTTTGYYDTAATPGVLYYYWVRVVNLCEETGNAGSCVSQYRALSPPAGVYASQGTSPSLVTVSWTPVTGALNYQVYKSLTDDPQTATTTGTKTTATSVQVVCSPGITTYFWVKAHANNVTVNPSDFSASAAGWASLASPQGIIASDGTYTDHIAITWNPVQNATHYRVYYNTEYNTGTATPLTGWLGITTATHYGVSPDTMYYYWVKAAVSNTGDRAGQFSIGDNGYVSWPPLTAPTNVAASAGTFESKVYVTWDNVAGATHYCIYRGLTSNASLAEPITGWRASMVHEYYDDLTAEPGVTCFYWVRAAANATGYRASALSALYGAGHRDLDEPTNVTASDGTYEQHVRVAWKPVTGANYYGIYRNTANNPATAQFVSGGYVSGTSFDDSNGVSPNVVYYYWVKAVTSTLGTIASDLAGGDTGWRRMPNPDPPTATDGEYTNHVYLSWTNTVTEATHYRVYRNTVDNFRTAAALSGWLPRIGNPHYDDTTATPGQTYFYWLTAATSSSGTNESFASGSDQGWCSLSAPTGVMAGDGASTAYVRVTWYPVTGATSYCLFRQTGTGPVAVSKWITATQFDHTTATPGVTYQYMVQAKATHEDDPNTHLSPMSNVDSGWRAITPVSAVYASRGSYSSYVKVDWIAPTGATHYTVLRNTTNDPTSSSAVSGWFASTSFRDLSAQQGTTYYYWIMSASSAGGEHSTWVDGSDHGWRMLPAPSGVAASDRTFADKVQVTWTPGAAATHYRVYRHTDDVTRAATMVCDWQAATTFDDTNAEPGRVYYYWVRAAFNASGNGQSIFSSGDTGARSGGCPADLDGDGDVDGADYGIFASCFNGTGNPIDPACSPSDLNGDNSIDGIDYGMFASCFNGTGNPSVCCPSTPTHHPADLDADGDVDGADFGIFAGCFNGTGNPITPGCGAADLNGDASVDGIDFGVFAGCFNGTGNPPACQ